MDYSFLYVSPHCFTKLYVHMCMCGSAIHVTLSLHSSDPGPAISTWTHGAFEEACSLLRVCGSSMVTASSRMDLTNTVWDTFHRQGLLICTPFHYILFASVLYLFHYQDPFLWPCTTPSCKYICRMTTSFTLQSSWKGCTGMAFCPTRSLSSTKVEGGTS